MPALSEFDLLLVMAQIAVAFAGFASLASAFGERARPQESRVDAGRLVNMLVVSLCTTMLALAPALPALFRLTGTLVWRSCAVIAIVTLVVFAPGVVTRTKRMRQYAGFNRRSSFVNFGLAGVAATAFVLCALGVPATNPSATYVTGLLALLLICAIVFFRVIASLLRPHAPE